MSEMYPPLETGHPFIWKPCALCQERFQAGDLTMRVTGTGAVVHQHCFEAARPQPKTRKTLDPQGCGTPFCGHDHTVLFLKARCHPHTGVTVSYDKRTGELEIVCARCGAPVVKIAVAKE